MLLELQMEAVSISQSQLSTPSHPARLSPQIYFFSGSFEYLSGEDPYLGYVLVQPVVRGIQSQGVIANVKHYVRTAVATLTNLVLRHICWCAYCYVRWSDQIDNNQEGALWLGRNSTLSSSTGGPPQGAGDRHSTSAIVDEQTQMELYWPPFEGAVEAGVLSVMCANNLVNGVYVCENNHTENTILKSWGGFKGWVCSDYDGTRSTIDAANGGLDIAMPGPVRNYNLVGACSLSVNFHTFAHSC